MEVILVLMEHLERGFQVRKDVQRVEESMNERLDQNMEKGLIIALVLVVFVLLALLHHMVVIG
jgi:hypothetical protein